MRFIFLYLYMLYISFPCSPSFPFILHDFSVHFVRLFRLFCTTFHARQLGFYDFFGRCTPYLRI